MTNGMVLDDGVDSIILMQVNVSTWDIASTVDTTNANTTINTFKSVLCYWSTQYWNSTFDTIS